MRKNKFFNSENQFLNRIGLKIQKKVSKNAKMSFCENDTFVYNLNSNVNNLHWGN